MLGVVSRRTRRWWGVRMVLSCHRRDTPRWASSRSFGCRVWRRSTAGEYTSTICTGSLAASSPAAHADIEAKHTPRMEKDEHVHSYTYTCTFADKPEQGKHQNYTKHTPLWENISDKMKINVRCFAWMKHCLRIAVAHIFKQQVILNYRESRLFKTAVWNLNPQAW